MQNQKRENSTQGGEVSTIQQILTIADRELETRFSDDVKRFHEYGDLSICIDCLLQLFHNWLKVEEAQDSEDRDRMSLNIHSIQRLLNDLAESERFVQDDMKFCINELVKEATTGIESEWLQSMRCKETTQTAN